MSNRGRLAAAFPSILAHEGVWEGTYRHLDAAGALLDEHQTRVLCEFPEEGDFLYRQHNTFTWPDGRVVTAELPATLRDGRLWWDAPNFHGSAWEAGDGVILLNLIRKDEPGAYYIEAIVMAPGGRSRARTWHWFKDKALIRRTLCDEVKVS